MCGVLYYICIISWSMFRKWYCYSIKLKERIILDRLEGFLSTLDHSLNTRKKRHIAGGILMSVSLLFGGLAITVMTLRYEENHSDEEHIE